MRNCYCSTGQCEKSYQGADGCAERTTRSAGLPALIALHYDHGDTLLTERASHSPLPVQLWQFFFLIEQDILHPTKEMILVRSLRCANCNQGLLLWVSISFPAVKTSAGQLLRVTLPCVLLTHICHSFKLTSEIGDELSESLDFFFSSSLRCVALVWSSSPGHL